MAHYLSCGPRLVSLNVEGTSFDNTCLHQLILCAKQLISLLVARTNITDDGFLSMEEGRGGNFLESNQNQIINWRIFFNISMVYLCYEKWTLV